MKNKNMSGGLFATGKPKPLTIRETPLSAQIAEWLDNRGIYNDRLNCGKVRTASGHWITLCKAGTPDRFAIVCGQIILIETKMRDEKPTADQLKKHDELRAAGAVVIVADDFYEFIAEFSAIRCEIETKRKGEINFYD